jgi:quercetin dioxygenase-like cupin family protein
MKKINYKINQKDKRGHIVDFLEKENINAVTFILSLKGSVRGNHFHKKTFQWNYILKGKLKLFYQRKNSKIKKIVLNKGDFFLISPNESHALKALTKSEMLVFTKGPRGGKEYENDTYRLKKKLI